ncbi:hypothetical protein [Bradyrhizobium sp. SZCCHNRI1073]|uniref:hypothetical protein n=1 Tax=Bradyrhizobium sp. SZCCHNRI1073 TaxID=3057280 RepID=UPI002916DC40|nr:hypothetical protein [Bradyrhizobium sp. SZCCHNRI1073]
MFGDGREERMDALLLELRLAANPAVTAGRNEYHRKVEAARIKARSMSQPEIINALCANNPAYIRSFLETEDERFGAGALVERYARTFYGNTR